MKNEINKEEYRKWLIELKSNILQHQIKSVLAVNSQLILMYWDLGKQIIQKQRNAKWGSGFIDKLSRDLKNDFPEMGGFSSKNLRYCRAFYMFYSHNQIWQQLVAEFKITSKSAIWQQAVAKIGNLENNPIPIPLILLIPWGHNLLILQKMKLPRKVFFYIQKTIEYNWSRSVLLHHIESKLYERQGKAINNFNLTLPKPQSDLAYQLLKDPYNFDFLTLTEKYNERDLENALTENITQFLLELGAGFTYVGRQYPIKISDKEYFIDLLFYHLKLRCYVVIELKTIEFKPEFAGKLNFYLSAVDDILKQPQDSKSIGLIICKNKDKIEVEYALRDINKPISISEYHLTKTFPEKFKGSLPTIEEVESELLKKVPSVKHEEDKFRRGRFPRFPS